MENITDARIRAHLKLPCEMETLTTGVNNAFCMTTAAVGGINAQKHTFRRMNYYY